jgi:hypothetical protein
MYTTTLYNTIQYNTIQYATFVPARVPELELFKQKIKIYIHNYI